MAELRVKSTVRADASYNGPLFAPGHDARVVAPTVYSEKIFIVEVSTENKLPAWMTIEYAYSCIRLADERLQQRRILEENSASMSLLTEK